MQHERQESERDSAFLDTRYGDDSAHTGYVDTPDESHASTGGAVVAGAATGGLIGVMGAGPVGGAVGAVGGAILGVVSERLMHGGGDDEAVAATPAADIDSHRPTVETRVSDEAPTFRSDAVIDRGTVAPMEADRMADDPHVSHADVVAEDQPTRTTTSRR